MKFYPIFPINAITENIVSENTFKERGAMVLAQHVLSDADYRNFYSQDFEYKILDNGAAEEGSVTDEQLIQAISIIKPNIVVCPDVLFNAQETIKRTRNFIDLLKSSNANTDIMVVPQGNTRNEYIDCMKELLSISQSKHVGVSKLGASIGFTDRCECVKNITRLFPNTELHLLGCNNPIEAVYAKQFSQVKSMDSCLPVLYGLVEKNLPICLDNRMQTPKQYFTESWVYDNKISFYIHENILRMQELCE
jgi:hypothetical protein